MDTYWCTLTLISVHPSLCFKQVHRAVLTECTRHSVHLLQRLTPLVIDCWVHCSTAHSEPVARALGVANDVITVITWRTAWKVMLDCRHSSTLPLVWSPCRARSITWSITWRHFYTSYIGCVFPEMIGIKLAVLVTKCINGLAPSYDLACDFHCGWREE